MPTQTLTGTKSRVRTIGSAIAGAVIAAALAGGAATAEEAKSVALLTTYLQNDHQEFEPTTDAERARMANIKQILKSSLEGSGKYKFVEISPDVQSRIDKDQKMGDCANCETRYGAELGADEVAWIEVQKVSNLILNINVYMKDVKENKPSFTKSVDIRGNTDETWAHSMKYLIKNYLLKPNA